jgi:Flp pilus assembly protein CpaB
MLSGIVQEGDHVDVVTTAKYHLGDLARATSRVVLRNLLVLKAPDESKQTAVSGTPTSTTELVMTDRQAQTMAWAMKQGSWFFMLRPTNKPSNSSPTVETLFSIMGRGLPAAPKQIAGNFPESVDAP